jgi:hypothetical protein
VSDASVIGLCNGAGIAVGLKTAAATGDVWLGFAAWFGAYIVAVALVCVVAVVREVWR